MYFSKPVVDPLRPNHKYPDWIIFKQGELSNPLVVITELELKQLVADYLSYHNYKVKGLTT